MPHPGFYWVIATGNIEPGKNLYPWGIVSSPFGVNLFILARDVEEFRTKYKEEVLEFVKSKGFFLPVSKMRL